MRERKTALNTTKFQATVIGGSLQSGLRCLRVATASVSFCLIIRFTSSVELKWLPGI